VVRGLLAGLRGRDSRVIAMPCPIWLRPGDREGTAGRHGHGRGRGLRGDHAHRVTLSGVGPPAATLERGLVDGPIDRARTGLVASRTGRSGVARLRSDAFAVEKKNRATGKRRAGPTGQWLCKRVHPSWAWPESWAVREVELGPAWCLWAGFEQAWWLGLAGRFGQMACGSGG
jgi:hypothetical protein